MELPKDETGMNQDPDGVLNETYDESDGGQSAGNYTSDLEVDLQISETEYESSIKTVKNYGISEVCKDPEKVLERMDVDPPGQGTSSEIHILAASMSISETDSTKNPETNSPSATIENQSMVEETEAEVPTAGSSADPKVVLAIKKNIPDQTMKIPSFSKAVNSDTVVPPESYKKIIQKIKEKEIPPKIGDGPISGLLSSECGEFFNAGDGRAVRTQYSEDICSLSIVSSSFNTTSLQCVGCPKGHSILENCGGGGRTTIVVSDQNFPGVLPSAQGKCLAILRKERGSLSELGSLICSTFPRDLARGTIILVGSLTHLMLENLSGYAMAMVTLQKKFQQFFHNKVTLVPFIPIPLGGTGNPQLVRKIADGCNWLLSLSNYPLCNSMACLLEEIRMTSYEGGEGGGGGGASAGGQRP